MVGGIVRSSCFAVFRLTNTSNLRWRGSIGEVCAAAVSFASLRCEMRLKSHPPAFRKPARAESLHPGKPLTLYRNPSCAVCSHRTMPPHTLLRAALAGPTGLLGGGAANAASVQRPAAAADQRQAVAPVWWVFIQSAGIRASGAAGKSKFEKWQCKLGTGRQ